MNILLLTFSAENLYLEYCGYALNCLKAYLYKDIKLRDRCNVVVKYYSTPKSLSRKNSLKKEIIEFIKENTINIAGMGAYIWNMDFILSLSSEIKEIFPETAIILGGPQVMYKPEEILRHNPFIDVIVEGDGEETFSELVKYYIFSHTEIDNIRGISYRLHDEIKSTRWAPPVPPENLPSPYLEGLIKVKRGYVYPVEGSRGCIFKCAYCHWGIHRISYFPLERVEKEVKFLIDNKISIGMFVDSAINYDRERAVRIIEFINKNSTGVIFTVFVSIHFLDKEFVELLNNSPCVYMELGIQSLNPEALKNINRRVVKPVELEVLTFIKGPFTIDLIYGLPGDNLEGFKETFQEVFRYTTVINLFKLGVHPGTALWEKREEFEIELEPALSDTVSNYSYSREDMRKTDEFKKNYEEVFTPSVCSSFEKEEILAMAASRNEPLFDMVNDYSHYLKKTFASEEIELLKISAGEIKRNFFLKFLR